MATDARALPLADGSSVTRGETLRQLPGKRDVFAGTWKGRAVIAKVFLDSRRGAVHAQREADGLMAFHAGGIAAPTILYRGMDQHNNPVILLQRIQPAESLAHGWALADADRRQVLLAQMMDVLVRQHEAGVCQTDLHLDNFLLSGGTIYSLDGAAVESQTQPLGQARSLENLALFFSQLLPEHDVSGVETARLYADRRGWPHDLIDRELPGLIRSQRLGRWLNLRPKLYRECSAIVHRQSAAGEYFAARTMDEALQQLALDPDATCPGEPGRLLKNGNTATVWRTRLDEMPVVVKRYNIKNRRHALKLAGRQSRASISWSNAHMLKLFGIATPRPLALVYRRKTALARVSYFIAEAVPGPDLRAWIDSHGDDAAAIDGIAAEVATLLRRLHALCITHGDMKATNIIVHDGMLYLIDLDAMRRHRSIRRFRRAWRRDMQRFLANWSSQPAVLASMRAHIGVLADE